MLLRVNEQRLLESSFADFVVVNPRQDLVRGAVDLDDFERFVHLGIRTEREH